MQFFTIYFGLQFDEGVYPRPKNETGSCYLGTKGLLYFLEAQLGLEGHPNKIEHIRTEQYRQALSTYLRKKGTTTSVFYKNSFEADQLACTDALLSRRDELLLAGWDFIPNTPCERLNVIADIEQTFTDTKPLIAGFADRFEAVLQALADCELPIAAVYVNEPIKLLPPQYQRLFDLLKYKNIIVEPIKSQKVLKNNQTSDISIIKKFVLNELPKGEKHKAHIDGSLLILEALRDTDAADCLAKIVSLNPDFQPVFLIPEKNRVLDDAFIQNGLPSFGLPSSSLGRPTLQLLKLVTTFLWRPMDPYKVLEFVTMPTKPLDSDLGTVIASLISQRPGIGSEQWFFETTRFFEELAEKAASNPSINVAKIKSQYDFWFKQPSYDIEKSAPKDEIIRIFSYLKDWASEEFELNNSKNTSLLVLSEQAKRIQEFLEELPLNDKFLTYLELERIIRTIYEPAPVQPRPCEVGHFPYVFKESCLIDSVDTLIWWNFTDTEGGHFFSRWFKEEVNFLESKGIKLQSPQDENKLMLWERVRPLLQTQKQIIFVFPKKVNGSDAVEHPLMSHLRACFDNIESLIVDSNKDLTAFYKLTKLKTPRQILLKHHQLGKIQPIIYIFSQELARREQETLTSLEALFYYPYQWVFRHKAKLSKSPILSIVKENTLKGNIAHRFFEKILDEDFQNWARHDVEEWVEQYSRRLFQREAATLMMYGYEPERVQLVRQVKYAIWTLICLIRQNNWQVVGAEKDLKGLFCDIPVKGKADLVLSRGSELCVLDLKWSGQSYREKLIKNGEDLQLIMYSRLLTEDDDWAHTAYYIIEKARLLARNTQAFNEIKPLLPTVDSIQMNNSIWEKMQKTFEWRLAQIQQGKIEIRTNMTAKELEEIYGEELIPVLEMKNDDAKFDDYRTLIGLVI